MDTNGEISTSLKINVAVRALDMHDGLLAIGTRDGAILEFDTNAQGDPKVYM